MLGITLPGPAAFCQLRIIDASPLAIIVISNRFIVAINESWNSLSLPAALSGLAQSVLMKAGGGWLGSAPGISLRNQGHISIAKAGFTFMACTCTSIIGRCFLIV